MISSFFLLPMRLFEIPEVLSVHFVPSGEVIMVPSKLTVTKSPFPYVTPDRLSVVPEVLEVHVAPSGEVNMAPSKLTVTKSPFP